MGIPIETVEFYDLSGGMNDRDADTALAENEWSFLRNAEFNKDGSIGTRPGSHRENDTAINSNAAFLLDFYYELDNGTSDRLIVVGNTLYRWNGGTPVLIQVGFSTSNYWSAFQLSNRVIVGNGIDPNYKWDGTNLWALSIVAPVDIGFAGVAAAGGSLTAGAYVYRYTYRNSVTLDESNPVNASVTVTTAAGNLTAHLTNFAVSADPQVDQIVIYRTEKDTTVPLFEIGTKANTNVAFDDTGLADGTFELVQNNDIAPTSAITCTFLNRAYYAVGDSLYYSKLLQPGMVPSDNFFKVGRDGQPITCLLQIGNQSLMNGKTRSIWILPGDPETLNIPLPFNTLHGVLNHRSASIMEDNVFFMDQSLKPYSILPTQLANKERRVEYIGRRLSRTFDSISTAEKQHVKCETVTIENRKQWHVSVALQSVSSTDTIIVFDPLVTPRPGSDEYGAWTVWSNLPAATLKVWPDSNGIPRLYRGDFNGFMWRQFFTFGDGASVNGTVSSATSTVITKNLAGWTINAFVGMPVLFPEGTGNGQSGVIASNTATTFTLKTALLVTPDATTTFAIGGIDQQWFWNWKALGSHEMIKRLWFLWFNLSQIGTYTTQIYVQFDFNTSLQQSVQLVLQSVPNSQWGNFLWGLGIWGGVTSIQDKLQLDGYFHHIRIGIINKYAGQPTFLNGASFTTQNKELFTK